MPRQNDPRQASKDVFWRDRDKSTYRCPGCGRPRDEVPAVHIHHLDERKRNPAEKNLIGLCTTCHLGDQHDRDVSQRHLEAPTPSRTDPPTPSNLSPER
jgi:hypothetical protein